MKLFCASGNACNSLAGRKPAQTFACSASLPALRRNGPTPIATPVSYCAAPGWTSSRHGPDRRISPSHPLKQRICWPAPPLMKSAGRSPGTAGARNAPGTAGAKRAAGTGGGVPGGSGRGIRIGGARIRSAAHRTGQRSRSQTQRRAVAKSGARVGCPRCPGRKQYRSGAGARGGRQPD